MRVSSITIEPRAGELEISSQIKMPGLEGKAWYRLPLNVDTDIEAATDAFFLIGLILAMGTDGELTMDNPVSRRLIYNARPAQDILRGWYPKQLVGVQLDVPPRSADRPMEQNRTVTCFTGGVDSFATLLANASDVDALLYIHGFDIPLGRTEIRAETSRHLEDVAEMTGKELIEGSTNIRRFLNLSAKWPTTTHGVALASVGHLLSARFGRMLLPSSHTYSDHYAWGSHPLLDHLWSNNRLSVIHDGAGATRVEKTISLAHDAAARRHLRVCWQNTGKYNCGKCDKCVRTMIALQLAEVLPEFETFESELTMESIRDLPIRNLSGLSFVVENLEFAKSKNATDITEALAYLVNDFKERRRAAKQAGTKVVPTTSVDAVNTAAEEKGPEVRITDARLDSLTTRLMEVEQTVKKLQSLLPIRAWTRFSDWRHSK